MRILGLDVGDKTIGVAISDELGWTAQAVEVIRRSSKEADLNQLKHWVEYYQVEEIVVGLPKNMNGTIGPRGEKCQAYAAWLAEELPVPIQMWDERLTTVSAQRVLLEADMSRAKRKKVVDKIAAAFILQGYLDAKSKR